MSKTIEMEQKFLSELFGKNAIILELTEKVESLEEQLSKVIVERDDFAVKLSDVSVKGCTEVTKKK